MSVVDCPLFEGRAFQYGPACAIAKGDYNRFLVYYPLGSGKTLAALHAARTFLQTEPEGHIIVITTKSNQNTTWPSNIHLYLEHVADINDRIKFANIYNVEWWFSQDNDFVGHYNALIQKLSKKVTRQQLIQQSPRFLKRYVEQFGLDKYWATFKSALTKSQKKQSMLEATIPPFPFMLIVDECQEYLNFSAQSLLVNALANAARATLLLTATPLNDTRQYSGLLDLMGTDTPSKSVLWSGVETENPQLVDNGIKKVQLSDEEWREHQRQKGSDDAYYAKSRQECNGRSKWKAIAKQIKRDIKKSQSPTRIVVYSFFRDKGVDGFFIYLQSRNRGEVNENKRFTYNYKGKIVEVSLMKDGTLDWFNDVEPQCKILLLTSKAGKGISLRNVYSFHLMEPQWSFADEEQAIGRCTRKGSHDIVDPIVRVTRWLAISPEPTKRTADERVLKAMLKKKEFTDRLNKRLAKFGKKHLAALLRDFHRT